MKTKACPRCKGTGKITDFRSVGAALRRLRKKAGLSVEELARKMAVTPEYLYMIETGKRNAYLEIQATYHAICGNSKTKAN